MLKDKIESGVKCCIPFTTRFQNTKWKRPLNEEIRDLIKSKKSLWRQYVRDKNPTSWLKYTKQRNKVKKIIRNDLKKEQNTVANSIKQIQKKWKYVNSKTKHIEKIDDLKKKDEHGNIVIYNAAEAKADILCEFFSSVFCIECLQCFDAVGWTSGRASGL